MFTSTGNQFTSTINYVFAGLYALVICQLSHTLTLLYSRFTVSGNCFRGALPHCYNYIIDYCKYVNVLVNGSIVGMNIICSVLHFSNRAM